MIAEQLNIVSLKNQFYTYINCRPDGTPFHVGKGKDGRSRDFKSCRNQYFKNIINKYGKQNIRTNIFYMESEAQARHYEIKWIAYFKVLGYELVNQTLGGEGISGYQHSLKSKRLMSIKAKEALKTKLNSFKGRKHTEESKELNRIAHLGIKQSPESNRRRSLKLKGRISPRKGKPGTFKGRKHTLETRIKMSDAKRNRLKDNHVNLTS